MTNEDTIRNAGSRKTGSGVIRVLIVDDSNFMQKALTHIIKSDAALDVAGIAADGEEAIRRVHELKPDVVLLDVQMPGMDGLVALEHIMTECPTPILMFTGLHKNDSTLMMKSLEIGAVDFISKPSGEISYDIEKMRGEIISKVKTASTANVRDVSMRWRRQDAMSQSLAVEWLRRAPQAMVVIGASTGGPKAVASVLCRLPRSMASAVLVVQHLTKDFIPSFAERLKWGCALDVSVAHKEQPVFAGQVLIAPGGIHTMIYRDAAAVIRIRFNRKPAPYGVYPSIDYAMTSAAEVYGERAVGVLMTGMGQDGALGLKAIKEAGGHTIAEDPSTCLIYGMPKAAVEMGCVDEVLPSLFIAQAIVRANIEPQNRRISNVEVRKSGY